MPEDAVGHRVADSLVEEGKAADSLAEEDKADLKVVAGHSTVHLEVGTPEEGDMPHFEEDRPDIHSVEHTVVAAVGREQVAASLETFLFPSYRQVTLQLRYIENV
jgi:hypothetical protein